MVGNHELREMSCWGHVVRTQGGALDKGDCGTRCWARIADEKINPRRCGLYQTRLHISTAAKQAKDAHSPG